MSKTDVMVVLLQGGQEVVATVEETAEQLRLSRPMKVVSVPLPMQTPQGIACQWLMQFIPLMPSSIRDFVVLKAGDWIGEPTAPQPQVKDSYLQLTTGIQIAR